MILSIVLAVAFNYNTSSMAKEIVDLNKVELNFMLNYSNYIYDSYGDDVSGNTYIREDLHDGTGFAGEAIYWLNKWGIGLGVEKNMMSSKWNDNLEEYEYSSELTGPYAKMIYTLNDNISLYNNIINYHYKEHYKKRGFNNDVVKGDGIGLLLGMKASYQINSNLLFILDTGYRMARIKIKEKYSSKKERLINNQNDENLKINGLRLALSLSYSF